MIFKRLAAIHALVFCMLQVRAEAAWWPAASLPQTPHPAVARIVAPERDGMSLGSGTLVDANETFGLVVTNWHVVRSAVGPIEVIFPDGFRSPGRIVRMDREWDLAAILIWKPPVQPVPISAEAPRPGQWLTIAGYGSGNYKAQSGPCTQYLAPGINRPFEIVEVKAAARQGDSGGPIFNQRGELAGVLFGEGGGRTSGSYAGRVQKFLELTAVDLQHLPRPSQPQDSLVAMTSAGTISRGTARFEGRLLEVTGETGSNLNTQTQLASVTAEEHRSLAQSQSASTQVTPSLSVTAPPSTTNTAVHAALPATGKAIRWRDEIKSYLAAIGFAAIALQLLRLTWPSKST